MPLSDREEEILQDIERRLYENDPKFVHEVGSTTLTGHYARNIRRSVMLFVGGLALLVVFFVRPHLLIGLAAFGVMLAGLTMAFQNIKTASQHQLKQIKDQPTLSGFFEKFEGRRRGGGNRGV